MTDVEWDERWAWARQMMVNHKSPGLIVRHLKRMLEEVPCITSTSTSSRDS
jgi:hypothetical protein